VDHEFLAGCREDVLRKAEGAWKVRRRTIGWEKTPLGVRYNLIKDLPSGNRMVRHAECIVPLDGPSRGKAFEELKIALTRRDGLGRGSPVAHPSPDRQFRGGAAGEWRGRGQDRVSGVPLADYHLLSGCREDALRKVNGA
jgi:hypothetical protein